MNGLVEYINWEENNQDREPVNVMFDTIMPNLEAFWEEYDNKRQERDPKILAIDEDFYDGFVGEERDKELAESCWNALVGKGQADFVRFLEEDEELKVFCENNGGLRFRTRI